MLQNPVYTRNLTVTSERLITTNRTLAAVFELTRPSAMRELLHVQKS